MAGPVNLSPACSTYLLYTVALTNPFSGCHTGRSPLTCSVCAAESSKRLATEGLGVAGTNIRFGELGPALRLEV